MLFSDHAALESSICTGTGKSDTKGYMIEGKTSKELNIRPAYHPRLQVLNVLND